MSRRSARLLGKRQHNYNEIVKDESFTRKKRKVEETETTVRTKYQPRTKKPDESFTNDETLQEVNTAIGNDVEEEEDYGLNSLFIVRTSLSSYDCGRRNPLPLTQFSDSEELWRGMIEQETKHRSYKDANLMSRHPELEDRMRSILLDWLSEVSQVFKLHRESYYLAIDYLDRYLSTTSSIPKTKLQLVGVTSLFLAAKYEEIHPSRLAEFSDISDGACPVDEILACEKQFLEALQYRMSALTPHSWLTTYLQTMSLRNERNKTDDILRFQFSRRCFLQCMRLLDLCMLDIASLQYPYSILSAAVLYHSVADKALVLEASGYKWVDVAPCIRWVAPFALTMHGQKELLLRHFDDVDQDDLPNIHIHGINLQLLDLAQEKRQQQETSPDPDNIIPDLLTPPPSNNDQRIKLKGRRRITNNNEGHSKATTAKSPGKENENIVEESVDCSASFVNLDQLVDK